MATFGARLKELRRNAGLTQKEFAQKISTKKDKVTASAVGMWEQGRRFPDINTFEIIADFFNVDMDYLKGKSDFTTRMINPKELPPNILTPGAIPIPILGEICAGDGIYGEENFQGMFFIDKSVTADYCLIVHGDSMIDAGVYDGDIAFLQKDFELIDGEIYAVVFGAEDSASLKKLYRDGKTVILQPCNDSYKPIVVDYTDLYVVGLLVGVYHRMK